MIRVEIEYCVPCGLLDRAAVQRAVLEEYGQDVEGVELVTGDDGVFAVCADGEVVFEKASDEFSVERIIADVGEHGRATA